MIRIWCATVVALLLLNRCGLAHAQPGAPANSPLRVPDDEAVTRATRVIKNTFRDDYLAASSSPQRQALAARLLKEGVETRDDPAARYVLLCEARDLASRSGDASTACKAIALLGQHYGVAIGDMRLQALSTALRSAPTQPNLEALVQCAVRAADQAIGRDEYDLARKLATVAETAASRSHRLPLIAQIQELLREINWCAGEQEQAAAAIEALSLNRAKPADRSMAGRHKCLVKGDWARGIPLLVDGEQGAWRALAEADIAAGGDDPRLQNQAAGMWWEAGENEAARARRHCRQRAAFWYRKALPGLTGLAKTTALKRIDEVDQAVLRDLQLEPGLLAEIFAGEKFEKSLARRIHPKLDFEWSGAPEEGLPKDHFSIRWTGRLRITSAGRHALTLLANQGGRVYIDESLVIDLPDGTHKRGGKSQSLMLGEGLHDLRVEFWDSGGLARLRLLWSAPNSPAEAPIPASAFFHEAGAER